MALWGCSALRNTSVSFDQEEIQMIREIRESILLTMGTNIRAPRTTFPDLLCGVKTSVIHKASTNIEGEKGSAGELSSYILHFANESIFSNSLINYVRSMGLRESDYDKDYRLSITIRQIDLNLVNTTSYCELSVSLTDNRGKELYKQENISSQFSDSKAKGKDFGRIVTEAFNLALEEVDWNRIASFLRIEQRPADEPQKIVRGMGDTALEQTIIRWDVQSRPQGADLFWRVVSKTPEVKSTNNKYLNTTPYEATKTLDIRGLTYQTAGNVRIILRCEKEGYFPQEKEYDVRMILDQEEISAFFRLVEEEK